MTNPRKEAAAMSHVTIFYGEMGSGKTYQGRREAERLGALFLEGDTYIPSNMLDRVKEFKPLGNALLNDYVFNHLTPAIVRAAATQDIVVAQALYQRKHRRYIESKLASLGITTLWIKCSVPFLQNLAQLWARPQGLRWVAYWLFSKPFFQGG
jgi:gluconate kinase